MDAVELCCLANSRKLQGRCVAGIDFAAGRWVRPVSHLEFRVLSYRHYQLPPPHWETRVFDQVRMELADACPECHHPEDRYLANAPWRLLQRPDTPEEMQQVRARLEPFLARDLYLFGTPEDRIPFADFAATPAPASLMLARVENPRWRTAEGELRRRNRVWFTYHGNPYNLSLTDSVWEQKLAMLPPGVYTSTQLGITAGSEVWLTVSLGEPYQGECFKLAATVMVWEPEA